MLQSLLPGRRTVEILDQQGHEEIAALTCALTALCVAAARYVAVGSRHDGYIVLPFEAFWGAAEVDARPWAAIELEKALVSARERFPDVEILVKRG
jgi:hypothetical protein